ncbi:MAG: GDSL-type esterase/lipase family protein [Candidatus Omnitrophica bacterium]|nr:GDSL-type esterase/lipase family protein [Candidatus Omnitrophota bacterium]
MKKSRLLFIIVLLGCWVMALISCAKQEVRNIDSQGKNIICFGDSITAGYGVGENESYPYLLQQVLNMPVINAGLDGDTTSEALKRLNTDVLEKEPYLVIIELGGNDFLRRMPLEQTIKNIEEMIIKIQDCGAIVALADISVGMIMDDYYREYKRLSNKYKTIFIPHLLAGILTSPQLKTDFIHPNSEGHRIIFERIYRRILPFIKRS